MKKCLICDSEMSHLLKDISDFEYGIDYHSSLVICPKCGLVSQSPEVTSSIIPQLYPDEYLAYSAGTTRRKGAYAMLKGMLTRKSAKYCISFLPNTNNGVVLEVGCGDCDMLRTVASLQNGVKLIGVDIKEIKQPPINNFLFLRGQLEELEIEKKSVDLIYCSNLIEHVVDPVLFLQKCRAILKDSGVLIGITPDHLSFDRYIFKKYWAGYHFPRHTFIFNHKNIRTLLSKCELDCIETKGSHAFWYLSLANMFFKNHGYKKRGILFALISLLAYPFDLLINAFRCHGSMMFIAKRTDSI